MRRTPPTGIMDVANPLEKERELGGRRNFCVGRGEHGIGPPSH
jgi:hypothetical protein